jgi:photosystem II stability/assembly factor-like uncharacterized protein
MFVQNVQAANETKTVGASGADYATLKAAFDAINAGTLTGNITLQIIASTTEPSSGATASLNASGSGSASYSSVLIYPTVSGCTINCSNGNPAITLNGADNVTIEGRVNQTGSTLSLTIANSVRLAIMFKNGACNNTVKYCTLKGSYDGATSAGIINFDNTGGGNSNNILEYNNITNGGTRMSEALRSEGAVNNINSGNIIRYNNFYDIFSTTGTAKEVIYLANYNAAWTIEGNSFYETTDYVPGGAGNHTFIYLTGNYAGGAFTISGNYIGGSAPQCGGTPLTKTNAQTNTFTVISTSVGTGNTVNIQGNIIKNITWENAGSGYGYLISTSQGSVVNIGTITGNIMGDSVGSGSITFSNSSDSKGLHGIYIGSTSAANISNNVFGSIKTTNTNSSYSTDLMLIYKSNSTGDVTVTNNRFGSTDAGTTNSIWTASASTASNQILLGLLSESSTAGWTITGNTFCNATNASTATQARMAFAWFNKGGSISISGNSVHDLTSSSSCTGSSWQTSVSGINLTGGLTGVTITDNTIYNLVNDNATFAGYVAGIHANSTSANGTVVSGNYVHSLNANGATIGAAKIQGIYIGDNLVNASNNLVVLGNNTQSEIIGIYDNGGTLAHNYYFNTSYIYGSSGSATQNSMAFRCLPGTGAKDFRNNVFMNARSGLSGSNHYAYYINYANGTLTSDYNDYYVSGTGGMLGYFQYNRATMALIQSGTGGDANSLNADPAFANAGSLVDTSYRLTSNLSGISGTGINTDYEGLVRASTPTMGAFQWIPVTTQPATSITINSATGNGTITKTGTFTGRGCIVYEYSDTDKAIGDAGVVNVAESGSFIIGPFTAAITGLAGNTRYNARAHATISGLTYYGNRVDFYTLASVPAAPTVNNPTATTLDVTVNANGNSATTEFAIQESGSSKYVQASGALDAGVIWKTVADWATITVTGLTNGNTYNFQAKARNITNVETVFGPSAEGTTGEKPTLAWQPGSVWSETRPVGDANKNWQSASLSSNGTIQLAAVFNGRIYKSADGGTTWAETQPAGDVVKNWNSVAVSPDGTTMLASISGSGRLYKSVDGGNNWSEAQPAGDVFKDWASVALSATGDTMLVAVSGGRIYKSTNSGDTWSETTPSGTAENKNWQSVSMSADGLTMLAGAGTGRLYKSTNGGSNWSIVDGAGPEKFWKTVSVSGDGQTMLGGIYDGRLYRSNNGGTTWSQTLPAGAEDKLWQSVSVSGDGLTMLATFGQGGRVYQSVDGGNSWSETQPAGNADKNWSSVAVCSDASIMMASVYNGRLYHSNTAIFTGITTTTASATGNITDTSGNATNRGAIIYPYTDTDKVIGGTDVSNVSNGGNFGVGAYPVSFTSLTPGARYNARAHATNAFGTGYSARGDFWTLANVPDAPTVNNPTATTLDVTVNANGNASLTEYVIYETSTIMFLQADGTFGAAEFWQTAAAWGTKTVTALTTGTEYTFQVKARNGDNIETEYSPTANGIPVDHPYVAWQPESVWSETQPAGDVDKSWQSVSLSSNGAIQLAAVNNGRLYKSVNGGTSWTETQPAGNATRMWSDVAVSNDGSTMLAVTEMQRAYKSTNGGDTWSETMPTGTAQDKDWKSVALSATGDTMLVAVNGGRVYKSIDAGTFWAEITPSGAAVNQAWYNVSLSDDGKTMLAAISNGRMYISTNGGTTWSETQPAGNADKLWRGVSLSADGNTIMAAIFNNRMYISSDAGATWSETFPTGVAENKYWSSVSLSANGSNMFAAIFNGRIYKSENGGTSWSETQPAGNENKGWQVLSVSSNGNKMLAAIFSSRLYHSASIIFTDITSTSASATGNIIATNNANATNRGAIIYPCTDTDKIIDEADVVNFSDPGDFGVGTYPVSFTGLTPNTRYNARAHATNTYGTGYSERGDFRTLAHVPSAPTVNTPTATTLDVTVNENSNPASTEFAIHETTQNKFVQADGTLGATVAWQTATVWGTKTVTALTTGTEYTFEVKARNGDNVETAYGPTVNGIPIDKPTVISAVYSDAITETQPDGDQDLSWYDVAVSYNGSKAIAGRYNRLHLYNNGIWTETRPLGDADYSWWKVSISGDGTKMLAAISNSKIYCYDGSTWSETTPTGVSENKNWTTTSMSEDGTKQFVAINNGRAYISINSGASWTETQPAGAVAKYWTGSDMSSDGNTIILSSAHRLYKTTNCGASWTELTPMGSIDKQWNAVAVNSSGTTMFAANKLESASNVAYISTDAGENWTPTTIDANTSHKWSKAAITDDGQTIMICGGGIQSSYDKVYVFADNTWTEVQPGNNTTGAWISCDMSTDGHTKIVADFGGRLYMSSMTRITDITTSSAKGHAGIQLSVPNSTIRGYILYPYDGNDKEIGGESVEIYDENGDFGECEFSFDFTGLSSASHYSARAYAINSVGTGYGERNDFYTLANVPSAPTVNNPTATTLDVTVNVNGNSSLTEFAIHETTQNKFVQVDGTLGATAVWQTAAAWGAKTVTGLTTGSTYTFEVKARNGDNGETAYGPTANEIPVDHPYLAWQTESVWSETRPAGDVDKQWRYMSVSSNGAIMVTAVDGGRMYKSSDGGVACSEIQPAGPADKSWSAVSISGDGSIMLASVSSGLMYKSADGGANWSVTGPFGSTNKAWMSVSVSSDGLTMLAAIYGGRIYKSTDGGTSWTETQPVGNDYRNWKIVAVSSDGNTMLAVHMGGILKSLNAGGTWSEILPSGTSEIIGSVSISADGAVMLVGISNGGVYKSTDYGTNWSETFPTGVDENKNWKAVSQSANGSVMVAAERGSLSGRIYKSGNGGTSWSETYPSGTAEDRYWFQVAMSSDGTAILAGEGGSLPGRLYRSTSGGNICTDITATSASATGKITSTNGANATDRGAIIYPYTDTDKIIGEDDVTNLSDPGDYGAGTYPVSFTSLTANSHYNARAHATNTYGTGYSVRGDFWTLAIVPLPPFAGNATATSLDVAINTDGNSAATLYAIEDSSASSSYLTATGGHNGTALWQTAAAWDTVTVSGLSTGVTYYFRVKAKNGNDEETEFSLSTAANTCSNPTEGGEIGSDQAICSGSSPALLTNEADASNYGGTLEYQWQSSTTNETDNFADILNKTEATYQPAALTQATWFRRLARVSCKADWTEAAISNVIKVRILGEEPISAPWNSCNTSTSAYGTSVYYPCENNVPFKLKATGQSSTTNDVMHFVYQTLNGNGTIIARLADVDNGGWAGVMMRESCDPNAKTILFKTRLYNPNVIIGYRTSTGSAMRNLSQVAQLIHWMKIQRNGNVFQVFTSYNGTTWLRRYTGTISMTNPVLAGVFTESILSNRTSVAWFDNVEVSSQLKTGDEFAEAEIINLDNEQAEVSIYPNPAKDEVNITMKGFRTLEGFGTLLTTDGKTVKTFTISQSETTLNIQDLKPGVYILRFENAENVVVKRLVIQ